MTYSQADFRGNEAHTINATGDCCVGDKVAFQRALFTGSFRKPKFAGFVLVEGEIVANSYGADKQQHTFTLRLADGSTTRIKGRNLYANGVWRQPWADEAQRREALADKHQRGDHARACRAERRQHEARL